MKSLEEQRAKKKSEFEDTDLGNESYNFLTKTYVDNFNKCAKALRKIKKKIKKKEKTRRAKGKKKSEFEDTDLGNESYNFLTKTYVDNFNKCAKALKKTKKSRRKSIQRLFNFYSFSF